MIDTVLIVGSVITALTVILTFFVKLYNFFNNLEKKYDEINVMIKANTVHVLKLAVLNDNLPITDRIHAGEEYIKLGGNGFVKKRYEKLLDEYDKMNNQEYP